MKYRLNEQLFFCIFFFLYVELKKKTLCGEREGCSRTLCASCKFEVAVLGSVIGGATEGNAMELCTNWDEVFYLDERL